MSDLDRKLAANLVAANVTERQWQQAICELASLLGWRWYHTHDSRRSPEGFPDLVLVKGGRLLFFECKTEKGRVTKAQDEWLTALGPVSDLAVVVRPSDWESVVMWLDTDGIISRTS